MTDTQDRLEERLRALRYPWPEEFGTREARGWNAAFAHVAAALRQSQDIEADLPCGYCRRDYPHSHSKTILIGPDPHPEPARQSQDIEAAGLDVKRLARAILRADIDGWQATSDKWLSANDAAQIIAAEYAALAPKAEEAPR